MKYKDTGYGDEFVGKYYRITYKGIGIYEAYHQAASQEEWKSFLDSNAAKWLKKPSVSKYDKGYASFFTEEGYRMFTTLVLPVFVSVLNAKQITTMQFEDIPYKYELIYHDEHQVVVDLSKTKKPVVENLLEGYSYIMNEAASINFKKTPPRKSKTITNKDDLKYLAEISIEEASEKNTIMRLFGDFGDGPKYNPYDIITMPARSFGGLYKKDNKYIASKKTNSSSITTTIGLWIFNKSFIEPFCDILGYINTPVTKDVYEDVNDKLSYALLEDKITVQNLKDFIMQSQILMSCCSAIASSHTELMFSMEELLNKKKEELNKKYGDKIKNNDLVAAKAYENELISYARDILKDDPAVDMFNSGARSSWGNNFKNMYCCRGIVIGTNKDIHFVPSSYINGMNPETDYVAIADASTTGPFSRARKTASGGYVERLLMASTAHVRILQKNSDCHTDKYITIDLDNKNVKDWYYSNIIDGSKLVTLTPDTKDKYIGKPIKLRFSSLCKSKNGCICEACAGPLFNMIGISNVGVGSSILGSSLKNAAMSKFHSTEVKLAHPNVNTIFGLE